VAVQRIRVSAARSKDVHFIAGFRYTELKREVARARGGVDSILTVVVRGCCRVLALQFTIDEHLNRGSGDGRTGRFPNYAGYV